jgi:hypothetical protein
MPWREGNRLAGCHPAGRMNPIRRLAGLADIKPVAAPHGFTLRWLDSSDDLGNFKRCFTHFSFRFTTGTLRVHLDIGWP